MPHYQWVGIDLSGQTQKGRKFCSSPTLLEKFLFEQDIALLYARPVREWVWQRWQRADLLMFLKQLEVLLGAGVFLADALFILLSSARYESVRRIIEQIKEEVEQGSSLSGALEKFPRQFDAITRSMICAGEESGAVTLALSALSSHLEFTHALYRRLRAAALLPGITFIVFMLVATMVMVIIIPKFAILFSDNNQQLPFITQLIIRLSEWLRTNSAIVTLVVVTSCFIAARTWLGRVFEKLSMALPFLSQFIVNKSLVFFLETLGLLLQGGVSLVTALHIANQAVVNKAMREQVKLIIEAVNNGRSLSSAMREQQAQFFPQDLVAMINVGEESGRLSSMVVRCAKLYEEKVQGTLDLFASTLQPLLMIFLGLVIALLIAAVYVPIFELSNTIV